MNQILMIVQMVISAALIVVILMQARGTGLGRTFGGGGGTSFSRRGLEKFIFKVTFVLAFLFIVISILQLVI